MRGKCVVQMRQTLSHPLIEESRFRVVQILGEEHTGIAVETGLKNFEPILGVKIRDDYE